MKYVVMICAMVCGCINSSDKNMFYFLSKKLESQEHRRLQCSDTIVGIISLYADPLAINTQYLWHCFFLNLQSAQKIIAFIQKNVELYAGYSGERSLFEQQLVCFFSWPLKKMSWQSDKHQQLIIKHNRSLLMNMARSYFNYGDQYSFVAMNLGSFLAQSYIVHAYLDDGNCVFSDAVLRIPHVKLFQKLEQQKSQKKMIVYYSCKDVDIESQQSRTVCSMQ